ncbi:MAG: NAD-dependent epimerase/dehydratase family protein [Candidatus Scalindua sp.]
MKTILLTGTAGFIGAKTAELLLYEGFKVIGLDNLNDYYDVRIKQYRLGKLTGKKGFQFNKIDIENYSSLKRLFKENKIDAVVNLAARAGVRYSLENPHIYLSTNAQGTLNLLEAMRINGVNKMVLASTSSLYAGQKMPFSEDLPVNQPISPYAASKKAAELMAYSFHYIYGLDISVVRYFTVFGPTGRPDMSVFRFIKWIDAGKPLELFGDGNQSRDFTYIDDIAKGTVKALKNVGFEIINLGGGNNPKSINYIINKIEGYLGKKAIIEQKPFHKADMLKTWADITKAKRILDWQPGVDVDEGLELTVGWHLENREWLKDVKL